MSEHGRTFVIGVDRSEEATKTCEWVRNNLLQEGDRVHLVTVLANPVGLGEPWVPGIGAPEKLYTSGGSIKEHEKEHEALESKFKGVFGDREHKVEVVRDLPTAKRVASILCNRAADMGAAALVLAQHKRSALAKMFVGSTVACAASTSTVPLLIVP